MDRIQIIYSIALWTILVVIELTIMGQFATRMQNKTRTRKRQQVICPRHKNTFTIDCNAFMKEYYSTQEYIGQSKNRRIELARVVG